MNQNLRNFSSGLLFFLAIAIAIYGMSFFSFSVISINFLKTKEAAILKDGFWHFCFFYHIFCGSIALLSGVFQFSARLREKYTAFHRTLGKIYVLAILTGSPAAFYAAIYANTGWVAGSGFSLLAIFWFITTLFAFLTIRKKQINAHREWMTRSYALTLAAVSLRIILPSELFFLHLNFSTAYQVVAWACWIPNLLFAEWLIRSKSERDHSLA